MTDPIISIPKEMNHRSNLLAFLGVIYSLVLFVASWLGIYFIWTMDLHILSKCALCIPFLICGGYGILLMGFMGHDGTHFNLHSNRMISCLLGIIVTVPIFPYLVMGFSISHWNHHKAANTDLDPDSLLFGKFKTLLTRSFLARPYSFLEYGITTLKLAFGIPLPFTFQFPLPDRTVQILAWINMVLSLGIGIIHVVIFSTSFSLYVSLLAIYAAGTVISGLSPYIEHTGTGFGRGEDTRTAVGLWWDVFLLGNGYHLEHHLYPTVPFYNLKKLYLHLKANGYYQDNRRHESFGVLSTYKYALGSYVYPQYNRKIAE